MYVFTTTKPIATLKKNAEIVEKNFKNIFKKKKYYYAYTHYVIYFAILWLKSTVLFCFRSSEKAVEKIEKLNKTCELNHIWLSRDSILDTMKFNICSFKLQNVVVKQLTGGKQKKTKKNNSFKMTGAVAMYPLSVWFWYLTKRIKNIKRQTLRFCIDSSDTQDAVTPTFWWRLSNQINKTWGFVN